jgi:hypothetical protein
MILIQHLGVILQVEIEKRLWLKIPMILTLNQLITRPGKKGFTWEN